MLYVSAIILAIISGACYVAMRRYQTTQRALILVGILALTGCLALLAYALYQ